MSFIVLEVHLSREGGREAVSAAAIRQTLSLTHSLLACAHVHVPGHALRCRIS